MDEFKKYADQAIERGERKLAKRIMIERRICFALVKQVLADGHALSVFDSEEWTVKSSRDEKLIRHALFTTDGDELVVRDLDNKRLGWFQLTYGNDGYDVIGDYTDNEYCQSVYDRLEPMIDKMETTA
jgi:hypothetical protein